MALVAHKYMPERMPESELRETFAAREHTLDYLVDQIRRQAESPSLTSFLLTGQRGSGKTTLVLMLALRLRDDPPLAATFQTVRLPEELPGVTSLRDLLGEIVRALADIPTPAASECAAQLDRTEDDKRAENLAVACLREIVSRSGKRLVVFVENLDQLFERALEDREQATLRRLLMDEPFMLLIGTAVRTFEQLERYGRPFFNYLCPVPLSRLDDGQVRSVLEKRAARDGDAHFSDTYARHEDKIRALTRMTAGNPRLVLMLYEVLSQGNVGAPVTVLNQLVDELTPVFKDVLEHQVSAQQAKMIDALMRAGGTATPSQLAAETRLSTNAVTTQLGRLKSMHLVDVLGGGKGAVAHYTIADPLFATWYRLRYVRSARRWIDLFVEVLCLWFRAEDRVEALKDFAQRASKLKRDEITTIEYLAASLVGTPFADEARGHAVRAWLSQNDLREAALTLAELSVEQHNLNRSESDALQHLAQWSAGQGDDATARDALNEAVRLNPEDPELRLHLGLVLLATGAVSEGEAELGLALATRALSPRLHTIALRLCGIAREQLGDLEGAMACYDAGIDSRVAGTDLVSALLARRAFVKRKLDDLRGACADYTRIIETPGMSVEHVGEALIGRGLAEYESGNLRSAVSDFSGAAELPGVDASLLIRALVNRSIIRARLDDFRGAEADCTAAIEVGTGPPTLVAGALSVRGAIRNVLHDGSTSLNDVVAALETPGITNNLRLTARLVVIETARAHSKVENRALEEIRRSLDAESTNVRAESAWELLVAAASPELATLWPRVWRAISEDQPPYVGERLDALRPLAEFLETGDPGVIDALPPEQRDFLRELAAKFKAPRQTGSTTEKSESYPEPLDLAGHVAESPVPRSRKRSRRKTKTGKARRGRATARDPRR